MNRREKLFKHYDKYKVETESRVFDGIEKNRKGNAVLIFTDKDGKTIPNVHVKVKLTNHEFLHGCNIYALDQTESDEKNKIYRQKYKEVFNAATLPIYWAPLEPEKGVLRFDKDSSFIYRRPPLDLCLEYCEENNIHPKAHCLNYFQRAHYPEWCPNDKDTTEIKQLCEKRFSELSAHYGSRIPDWEVINETLGSYCLRDTNPPIFFEPNSIEWSFSLAEKYFPNNRLLLNEDTPSVWCDRKGERSAYYLQIERALSRGARIDLIGIQGHMIYEEDMKIQDILCNPMNMFETLDLYSEFNIPIQITEVTIPALTDDHDNEELQAEWLKNLYFIWFSHHAVEAVTYWDMVDGYGPGRRCDLNDGWNIFRGGLLRNDMTEKPSFKVLKHLFNEKWHTEESFSCNENGKGFFRGFYGTYNLEIDVNGKKEFRTFDLKKSSSENINIII